MVITLEKDRRLAIGAIVAMVVGFVGAGVLVLRSELSPDEEVRAPGAWEVAWDYLTAFDDRKATAAAELTDDPKSAGGTLRRIHRKLPDASVSSALGEVKTTGDKASGRVDVRWKFADGRTFSYRTKIPLVRRDGKWLVDFTPAVVHPELESGQHIAVVNRSDVPAVVDEAGKALLSWGDVGPRPSREGRAKILLPAMLTRAQEGKPPERWAVAAMNAKNKRVKILSGSGPKGAKPLKTTLSVTAQHAAQAAVDGQSKPSALVAFRPSSGAILAVAQNKAADHGPIALSGLYPPGSAFQLVTGAAEGTSARAMVLAANSLGLNSDFDIPGIATEAGAVRKAADAAQLAELSKGQGEAKASPFGLALVVATVAAGKPVTPQFWASDPTKVIKSYPAPGEDVLTGLRATMRESITEGSASALASRGEVYGVAGTAKAGNGVRHSWFAGYVDDVAFAVLVEDGGSERPAVAVSGKFLGAL